MQRAQLKSFSPETVANTTSSQLAETFENILVKETNIQQLNQHFIHKFMQGDNEFLRTKFQINSFIKILALQWHVNYKTV